MPDTAPSCIGQTERALLRIAGLDALEDARIFGVLFLITFITSIPALRKSCRGRILRRGSREIAVVATPREKRRSHQLVRNPGRPKSCAAVA